MLEGLQEEQSQWHFAVAAMRVEHLIWDRILSSEAAVTPSNQGIVL